MSDKDSKEQILEQILDRLVQLLQEQGMILHNDDCPIQDKLIQVDVLLNTMHFLKDYDENVKVLNEYWIKKHHEERLNAHQKEMEICD